MLPLDQYRTPGDGYDIGSVCLLVNDRGELTDVRVRVETDACMFPIVGSMYVEDGATINEPEPPVYGHGITFLSGPHRGKKAVARLSQLRLHR